MNGEQNGEHRKTSTAASGGAVDAANRTDVGAQCTAAVANAIGIADHRAFETGVRAGEIIAHRGWRVSEFGEHLTSIWAPYYWWTADDHRARDHHPLCFVSIYTGDAGDDGPTPCNAIGFHAFKTKLDAELYCRDCWSDDMAVGTVALWGEVIEHEFGYRAEFARIVSLDRLYLGGGAARPARLLAALGFNPLLRRLRRRYGVP